MVSTLNPEDHARYMRKNLEFLEGFVNALPLDNAARAINRIDGIRENLKHLEKEIQRLGDIIVDMNPHNGL